MRKLLTKLTFIKRYSNRLLTGLLKPDTCFITPTSEGLPHRIIIDIANPFIFVKLLQTGIKAWGLI